MFAFVGLTCEVTGANWPFALDTFEDGVLRFDTGHFLAPVATLVSFSTPFGLSLPVRIQIHWQDGCIMGEMFEHAALTCQELVVATRSIGVVARPQYVMVGSHKHVNRIELHHTE